MTKTETISNDINVYFTKDTTKEQTQQTIYGIVETIVDVYVGIEWEGYEVCETLSNMPNEAKDILYFLKDKEVSPTDILRNLCSLLSVTSSGVFAIHKNETDIVIEQTSNLLSLIVPLFPEVSLGGMHQQQ